MAESRPEVKLEVKPENRSLERLTSFPPFGLREECQKFGKTREHLEVMQINICRSCNLSCKHCHLNAGPNRTEMMELMTMEACLDVFKRYNFKILDITGGAPEFNPNLKWLIERGTEETIHVIVRTNLVVLRRAGYEGFLKFYAENKVELVASLPYYTERDTDRQRGMGVFKTAIAVMEDLNHLGYGEDPDLILNLVYNPGGAFLPPSQENLTFEYKKKLFDGFGVRFNNLYALTNNPIGRFGDFLENSDNLSGYLTRLVSAFNPAAVENMMCRNQISVDFDGTVYDCDFNLALGLPINGPHRIQDYDEPSLLRRIVFANHCYACTAGAGSSCGGTTA
jgi:radical SAM/Cys-rich protein